MKIGFIGAGKAGNSIARYLKDPQNVISGFYSKTYEHAKDAADRTGSAVFLCLKDVILSSDIIFITTPDGRIREVWEQIRAEASEGNIDLKGKILCHCSGSLSSQIFEGCGLFEASACAAHPMQAISGFETDLTDTFFTIDGNEPAVTVLKEMLEGKGNSVAVIDSSCKRKYHMAASTASNLVVGLIEMAISSLEDCGFSGEDALKMLTPLIKGNISNICEKGTADALTGPVERADCSTVLAHLHELEGDRQQIYRLLSLQLLKPAQEKNPARDYSNIKEILEEKYQ